MKQIISWFSTLKWIAWLNLIFFVTFFILNIKYAIENTL